MWHFFAFKKTKQPENLLHKTEQVTSAKEKVYGCHPTASS